MKRAFLVILASSFAIASSVVACSSSSSPGVAPSVAGDSGLADSTTAGGDASSPFIGTESCVAQIRYDQRCADNDAGTSSACSAAREKDCGKFVSALSDVYRKAIVACYTDASTCGQNSTCVDELLAVATPTAAQIKVRTDYCATCGPEAGATCARDFYTITPDGAGAGYGVIRLSDLVLIDLEAKCTGAGLDLSMPAMTCREAFTACVTTVTTGASPVLPDKCQPPQQPDPPVDVDAAAPTADGG